MTKDRVEHSAMRMRVAADDDVVEHRQKRAGIAS
jgi:hypothetical protein